MRNKITVFQIYFSLRRRPPEIIFISARGNLPEIISKLSQRLVAAYEYFQTTMFNVAEIILK